MTRIKDNEDDQIQGSRLAVSCIPLALVVAVTGFALGRRRLIEQNRLSVHRSGELVAIPTGHVLVCALQRESCARVVIEFRRLPASYVVAAGAVGHVVALGKLPAVRILVAARAKLRRGAKIDVLQGRLKVGRTVAVGASHAAVRARQREIGLGMVECAQLPRRCAVAGLASCGASVGAFVCHLLAELATVWILVASGAGAIFKSVLDRRCRASWRRHVALRTWNGDVRSRQREARLLVASESKLCRLESPHAVTLLAAIPMRCAGELALVGVLVAVLACGLRNLEYSLLALGEMALIASDRRMAAFQRIRRRRMRRHAEGRRLEPFDGVTSGAFSLIGPRRKLPMVRVRVAIRASGVRDRSLEIAAGVAIGAGHGAMLSEQREICFRMIEAL